MNLTMFIGQSTHEVRLFSDYWRDMHNKCPEHYPLGMNLEEWIDQFQSWREKHVGATNS